MHIFFVAVDKDSCFWCYKQEHFMKKNSCNCTVKKKHPAESIDFTTASGDDDINYDTCSVVSDRTKR